MKTLRALFVLPFLLQSVAYGGHLDGLPLSLSEAYNRLMELTFHSVSTHDAEELLEIISDFAINTTDVFASVRDQPTQCQKDIRKVMQSNMDSFGTKPAGLLKLNFMWLGDFDQCLEIKRVENGANYTFGPRYCRAGLGIKKKSDATTPKPTIMQFFNSVNLGVCIPDSCQVEDIADVLASKLPSMISFLPEFSHCVETNLPLDEYAVTAISCYSVVGFFLAVGLAVDIYTRTMASISPPKKNKGQMTIIRHFSKLAICCSPLTNFEKLFKPPSATNGPFDLSPVNAIRALSLVWVVAGHTYVFILGAYDNTVTFFGLFGKTSHQFILSGVFAVDTFLFLAGFLAYFSISKLCVKVKHSFLAFLTTLPRVYFHRYVRLTVPYAALILLDIGIYRYLYYGPLYFQSQDWNCLTNWWTNILYVSNFVDTRHMCLPHSWYLPVDMQLFILTPFIVFAFVRKPVIGYGLCSLGIVVQIVTAATLTVVYNLPMAQFPPKGSIGEMVPGEGKNYSDFFETYYIKPYTRCGPYIVGIVACHLLVEHHAWLKKHLLPKLWVQFIGWLLYFLTVTVLIYGLSDFNSGNHTVAPYDYAIYNSIARTAWAISLGWLLLSAATKNAGIIGEFLSWPVWAVPARLSYFCYLMHPLVLMFYQQSLRQPFHMDDINMIFTFLAAFFNSLVVSTIMSLSFESPVVGLL